MIIGVDVSEMQPAGLPWAAWYAAGARVAVVRASIGFVEDGGYERFVTLAAAAGFTVGAYHALLGHRWFDPVRQARDFIGLIMPQVQFCALDIEAPGTTAADVAAWIAVYKQDGPPLPLILYGNMQLETLLGVGAYPELGLWVADYGPGTPTRKPLNSPHIPRVGHFIGHQFAGNNGRLPPYTGQIDLTQWATLPTAPQEKPMPVPIVAHGPKLGIHSIQPGTTIPLVKLALAAGWHWPVVKILHDASVAVDVKAISPQTLTIVRYMPPSLDDEGLQNVETWALNTMQAWAKRLIDLIFDRTAAAHMPAVDYWDVTNEPGAHGVFYYLNMGLAFCELVRQADRRGVHLSLPALPQGVPEWAEMQALVETGLFGLMKKGGHIYDCHEGVFTDQPIDFGFGDLIPGAPTVPGSGSTNFRHKYLYALLEQRGECVPLVVSEFYGGGRYTNPPADQVARFAWYDQRARQEPYLLAFCPFTINPDGGWINADYGPTYASAELWAYIAAEKDKLNATEGDTTMPITAAEKQSMHDAATVLKAGADGLLAQIDRIVVDVPPANWWDKLPAGVFASPINYGAQPAPYNIYGPVGQKLAVNPRNNAGQIFERQGDLLRVTTTPPVAGLPNWWVKAEELIVHPV